MLKNIFCILFIFILVSCKSNNEYVLLETEHYNKTLDKIVLNDTKKQDKIIRIGCFNTEVLGNTKISRANTFTTLAEIAIYFDILALVEVGDNGPIDDDKSKEIMEKYISRVNELAGKTSYDYISHSQYAIVFNTDKIKLVENREKLYTGNQTFAYPPLIGQFSTIKKDFDFSIICIHTRPEKIITSNEILSLKEVINDVVLMYNDPDIVCLGDFNGDLPYYPEGEINSNYFNGFPANEYITVIPNSADTTVKNDNNITYDRIQLTKSLKSRYKNSWGVFHFSEYFDVSICEGTPSRAGTERAISNHYPVWVELNY